VKKQMKEIIFEVIEQRMGQGFLATAIGVGIHKEADTIGRTACKCARSSGLSFR